MTAPTGMTSALTYTRVLPSVSERRLAQQLSRMDGDIATLFDSLRTAQLGTSTIQGTMAIRDADGVLTGIIGVQGDGTTGISYQNGSPPPIPNTPDLIPFPAGLYVAWNGQFPTASKPANFRNVEVYLGTTPSFVPGPSNYYGILTEAGQVPIGPLNSGSAYYALLIATNLTEKAANTGTGLRATATASLYGGPGSPQQVVAQAVLQGIIDATALADESVTAAKVAVAAIDGTKIADDSITSPKIVAGTIQGADIAAQTISGGLIATDTLDARTIGALAISADALQANSITAGALTAGCITAAKLETDLVLASRLVAGTLAGARVEIHPTLGIQGFRADGVTQTFWLRADTGAFTATGSMQTAFAGSRIVVNYNGGEPDRMRFYPSSGTNFACIDSIDSVNGAGIELYSASAPGSSNKRGIVIAREDIASLIYATTDLTVIDTDIFAKPGNIRNRAGIIDMMCDSDQVSNARVVFQVTDGVSAHSNTILYYHDSGADEPHFAAVNNDVGITFGDQPGTGLNPRVWIVGNTITQRRDMGLWSLIYDGVVVASSSRDLKRNITTAQDLDARQAVRVAKPHYFQKNIGDEPAAYGSEGQLISPAREAPVQFGLIAEDMPAVCQHNIGEVVKGSGEEFLGVSLDATVTLLWQGQSDVNDRVDKVISDPKWIPELPVAPPPPTSGATLYAETGSVYALFPSGKRIKIA